MMRRWPRFGFFLSFAVLALLAVTAYAQEMKVTTPADPQIAAALKEISSERIQQTKLARGADAGAVRTWPGPD